MSNFIRQFNLDHKDTILFTFDGPEAEFEAALNNAINTDATGINIGEDQGTTYIILNGASKLTQLEIDYIARPIFESSIAEGFGNFI